MQVLNSLKGYTCPDIEPTTTLERNRGNPTLTLANVFPLSRPLWVWVRDPLIEALPQPPPPLGSYSRAFGSPLPIGSYHVMTFLSCFLSVIIPSGVGIGGFAVSSQNSFAHRFVAHFASGELIYASVGTPENKMWLRCSLYYGILWPLGFRANPRNFPRKPSNRFRGPTISWPRLGGYESSLSVL